MSHTTDVVIGLGCDYLTCTAKDRKHAASLYDVGSSLMQRETQAGNKKVAWGLRGITGWSSGSVQLGTLEELVCVRLSSAVAHQHWPEVVQHSDNVSRIDLQATVRVKSSVTRRIDSYKRTAQRDADRTKVKKVVRWIQEHHGGYTLYLGDRGSEVFGRIYDKHEDTPIDEYRDCIRFEAQFQKRIAKFVAHQLLKSESQIPTIAGYVRQFFASRGIVLERLQMSQGTYCCPRIRSDLDKNLVWLAQAVSPCIRRLMDAGRGDEALRALGLIVDD